MKSKRLLLSAISFGVVLSILMFACKDEYVYVGTLNPDSPQDTTSTGSNGGGTTVITKPCSPDSVYFELSVMPILRSNCALSGCHDAISREEGIILDSYTNTIKTGKIKLNSPASSKLYTVLNLSDPEDRMPPAPSNPLTNSEKAIILKWIQQGAKNLSCEAICDSTQTSFKSNILPILTLQCKGCHSGTAASGGGILLSTYAEIKKYADNGALLGSLVHAKGYSAMPKNGKLPDCDISKIRSWIRQGKLNN
ncbi:MAG TPA: hypothetical protein PLC89_21570 [Haliscomenobacter sp.]|uniref:hypothetical protein n=1 Tax=Haliscomenobacter sp. TaxID=2717303 RepID=UPI002BC2AE79|nr:hypothetical protein [Haliscomenobacter sp.]HOY19917.1 hypothetical protein [Haliscomenobacter sp.]HPH17900.1 hypothetical protein [Haliscomenobacter sp.]